VHLAALTSHPVSSSPSESLYDARRRARAASRDAEYSRAQRVHRGLPANPPLAGIEKDINTSGRYGMPSFHAVCHVTLVKPLRLQSLRLTPAPDVRRQRRRLYLKPFSRPSWCASAIVTI